MNDCKYKIFLAICFIVCWSSNLLAQEAYPVLFESVKMAVLSSKRTGVLESLKFDIGDTVKKGDTIASVDSKEVSLLQKRSELVLKHMNVQVENLTKLNQRGLATTEDLAEARKERDIARTDIEIFKRQISNSNITAPFDCIVVKRFVDRFEWVTEGQPVVEVLNPGELKAVGNIPSHMAVQLSKGTIHSFYVHDLALSITGTVTAVAPEVDERSNTAQVIWKIDKSQMDESLRDKLLPGMKGEVRFGE